jgi:hypothetical protein
MVVIGKQKFSSASLEYKRSLLRNISPSSFFLFSHSIPNSSLQFFHKYLLLCKCYFTSPPHLLFRSPLLLYLFTLSLDRRDSDVFLDGFRSTISCLTSSGKILIGMFRLSRVFLVSRFVNVNNVNDFEKRIKRYRTRSRTPSICHRSSRANEDASFARVFTIL